MICHLGIYASEYKVEDGQEGTTNIGSITNSIGFSGSGSIEGSVIDLNGNINFEDDEPTSIIDAIIDALKHEINVNIDSLLQFASNSDSDGNKSNNSQGGYSNSETDYDFGMDSDIMRKLGFYNTDSIFDRIADESPTPYYWIPIPEEAEQAINFDD